MQRPYGRPRERGRPSPGFAEIPVSEDQTEGIKRKAGNAWPIQVSGQFMANI